MRNILLFGAGKSSSFLIQYLLEKSKIDNFILTIGDKSIENLKKGYGPNPNLKWIEVDIFNIERRQQLIQESDIVVSLLPARLHIQIAKDCLAYSKNLITASYISDEMKKLQDEVEKKGLIFLNEIGLDPGIDHMSAMQKMDEIRDMGGKIILFESFTGGLVAPESDNNLWHYKFTWNPRNVVLAGQGGVAKFIQENTFKYIPYQKLFRRTEFLEVPNYGRFEAYANRDSLKYQKIYNLENVNTLYRGTIRRVGYSRAWNAFVQLGMTDDSYTMEGSEHMSYRDFVNAFLPYSHKDSVELKFRLILNIEQDDIIWGMFEELELFNADKKVELKNATPAQILQKILMEKWSLSPEDKDMIVMYHKFGYELNGKKHQSDVSMVALGEDQTYTAMAKTVGLPVAMATLKVLNGEITRPGVILPIYKDIYNPILKELESYGVVFQEKKVPYFGYNPLNM